MVPHGSPFRDADPDDWIALGKSSESRLEHDDNAVLYINPLGRESRALKYIKIGVDQGMARYARSVAMYEGYDDMVLRMVPLQNAVVRVDVRECPTSRSRKLECRFQGSSAVFSQSHISITSEFTCLQASRHSPDSFTLAWSGILQHKDRVSSGWT